MEFKGKFTADISKVFGTHTFSHEAMKERLPKEIYKALLGTIEKGIPMPLQVADAVALAMKDWAISNGATHFTHWFQPLTGGTAEKHDSFLMPTSSGALARFSGKDLIQGEPDASSFPSGGIRVTFEARGYTAWDPTSPAFLLTNPNGATLCIPTVFASWTGEALDTKTPLLRSMDYVSQKALRALRLFGDQASSQVTSTVGCEQEYFLIDESYFFRRPDLVSCGRTLFGAQPPKGQEMEDHYFGSIPERVLSYMMDVEYQLYRLGVPVKTRHNEVAPGQYEIAPIFETTNLAADHQQLLMQTLRNTAPKYKMVCLLHEKPFVGINGSGKHNNWSLSTDTGINLLDPGDTPHSNLQFLFFCAAVIKAVDQYQDLLRISVASAHNDHRLGANEAPPAIISIFLGEQLEDVFKQLETGKVTSSKSSGLLGFGASVLPQIHRHAGDRNRTSPFAFTGNKFEFRAVGASQSVSFPNIVLNTIMGAALDELSTELEAGLVANKDLDAALFPLLAGVMKKHKRIIFNGDGYSEAWRQEAKERGLHNLRTAVDAIGLLCQGKNVSLFEKAGVLSERELHARMDIMLEQYAKTVNIEGACTLDIGNRQILPAALTYLHDLTATYTSLKACGVESQGTLETLKRVSSLVDEIRKTLDSLKGKLEHQGGEALAHATFMRDNVLPAMSAVRKASDHLEGIIPKGLWPLPTYQEMLYFKS